MVNNVIYSMIKLNRQSDVYSVAGNVVWIDSVPTLSQATTYYCGNLSALQVIVSKGASNNIPRDNYNEKQIYLDKNYFHLQSNTGAMVYQIAQCIDNYAYTKATTMSIEQFKGIIHESLRNNNPPNLHAIPKYLSYYPNSA